MLAVSLAILVLIPATLAAGYYFFLTTLGWWPRRRDKSQGAKHSFAILIPAHNEEQSISATIGSIYRSDYPSDRIRVFVVADNCTDRTAAIARAAGTECLERSDFHNRGKGYALAFGIPEALKTRANVVLILDADCELEPDTLKVLDASLATGSQVVQAAVVTRNPDDGPTGQVTALGLTIDNAVDAGLAKLGRTTQLRGSGMALTRDVLERLPWTDYGLTEDAEYTARLTSAGICIVFAGDAIVRSEAPAGMIAFRIQRRRWRAALRIETRSFLARWLSSKPLVLAQLGLTYLVVGVLVNWMSFEMASLVLTWCGLLTVLTSVVYFRAIGRTDVAIGGLAGIVRIAGVVGRLGWMTLGVIFERGRTWQRTPRTAG